MPVDPLVTGLPENVEAEQAVLGAVLDHDAGWSMIAHQLQAEDFSRTSHQRIFRAMADLYAIPTTIDSVTVAERLEKLRQLEDVGGRTYLAELMGVRRPVTAVDAHVRIVKDNSVLRRAITVARAFVDRALLREDPAALLEQAERFNRALASELTNDRQMQTVGDISASVGGLDGFIVLMKTQGLPTPWPSVNKVFGFRKKELTLLGARPGVGKTAHALQIALHVARQGHQVDVFSLEMSKLELMLRLFCLASRVDSNRVRRGELDPEERKRFREAEREISNLPLCIDDRSGCTVTAIHAAVRRHQSFTPVGLVIVDYVQLMTSMGRTSNRNEQVSNISRDLKLAASDLDVPFLVLSQLSRLSEHEKRQPRLSDLRDTGSLEQDANNVIFLHPQEANGSIVIPTAMILAKQRNGFSHGGTNEYFRMMFNKMHGESREETYEREQEHTNGVDYKALASKSGK